MSEPVSSVSSSSVSGPSSSGPSSLRSASSYAGERGAGVPVAGQRVLASGDYATAQGVVDGLSDRGFPVEHTTIVGTGLQIVENVTGRLTWGRVLLSGAVSGAWFGLLVGLLFGLLTVTTAGFLSVLLYAVLLGVVFGAVAGAVAYALTGGRRDFTSSKSIVAASYDVLVDAERHEEARQLLADPVR